MLRQAVDSRAVIGQAISVLICLHQISPDTGFTVLRTTSQRANTKLHTAACRHPLGPHPPPTARPDQRSTRRSPAPAGGHPWHSRQLITWRKLLLLRWCAAARYGCRASPAPMRWHRQPGIPDTR
ncbi:ANTAR domain-containing protein [Streptomyces sp. NPDC005706]|uniref:ANTAR domain-containing protein n=1 Tax=Streptomyces sp. NPDC005706 TaxID=3157169 RepID=UPI0033D1809A